MSIHFEQELGALRDRLLSMASYASTAVSGAVRALVDRSDELAHKVETDDNILDQLEKEIDDTAIHLLSKAPLATDLRFITAALKISNDLERVGDEATTIARRARELNREPQLRPYIDIPRMATMSLEMMADALDAFVHRDPDKARHVVPRDKEVDRLNKQLHRELSSFLVEDPHNISRALNLMVISKCLERIADHAKNIAEKVVYLCEATDIRHSGQTAPGDAQPG